MTLVSRDIDVSPGFFGEPGDTLILSERQKFFLIFHCEEHFDSHSGTGKLSECSTPIQSSPFQGDCFAGFRYGRKPPPTQPIGFGHSTSGVIVIK